MRLGSLETLRDLRSTLWTLRTSHESSKIIRTTVSLLRCFLFFDLCYLVTGMAMITVGLTNDNFNKEWMIIIGGFFGGFASVSAFCNSLASHGLRSWRRGYLIPWLMFYLMVLSLLLMIFTQNLYYQSLQLKQVFLFLSILAIFSCWRHMQKQFLLMAFPRPEQVVLDVEAVMRDYLSCPSAGGIPPPGKDLPPKYEEVEDLPPQYDENTMVPQPEQPPPAPPATSK